jgi:ribosomal protein S18 acetylase RimI-like enzyme
VTTASLQRPVWDALATRQQAHSLGDDRARCFAPDIGPLAAARDESPASLRALGELVPPSGSLLLLQADPIVLPDGIVAVSTATGVQMIGSRALRAPDDAAIVRLGDADLAAMLELALLTRPGPFAVRTPCLGEFWGIKRGGRLLAMAGERMQHAGFTEVSGVCTHPDARGEGLARTLSTWVAARITARGQTPYLHAYAANNAAIGLYRSLGFVLAREMQVAVIARG